MPGIKCDFCREPLPDDFNPYCRACKRFVCDMCDSEHYSNRVHGYGDGYGFDFKIIQGAPEAKSQPNIDN
jgi:hypothetical protein